MEKYLFTDGTNGIREIRSASELHELIRTAADPSAIRIWVYQTSSWLSLSEFQQHIPAAIAPVQEPVLKKETVKPASRSVFPDKGTARRARRVLYVAVLAVVVVMVYNFTRLKWYTASALQITAERPANVPVMNIDSLFQAMESDRGQKLDKVTKTNLRIRNTWPDRILLQLQADRDSSREGLKFYNMAVTVDNTTGYNIDKAIVEITTWKDELAIRTDTLTFNGISYVSPVTKQLAETFQGDSLSLAFSMIKAKSFNFCYAANKKSNYGSDSDKWFCRD